jgi:hypothetical protein
MRKLILVFLLSISVAYPQANESKNEIPLSSIGYEMRTNGKSYLSLSYKRITLRHRSDKLENRITYTHSFFKDVSKLYLSVPLHYKIEADRISLEPGLLYKFPNFTLKVQKEFWYKLNENTAILLDLPYKDFTYRVGWDTSNTFRFRLKYKF